MCCADPISRGAPRRGHWCYGALPRVRPFPREAFRSPAASPVTVQVSPAMSANAVDEGLKVFSLKPLARPADYLPIAVGRRYAVLRPHAD